MSLVNDLRLAARVLTRRPGFLATAVLSLGLGLGAATAAFSVVDAVRFRALPFPEANRLVVLSEVSAEGAGPGGCEASCEVSYETFANVLRPLPPRALDAVAGFTSGGKALTRGGEPEVVRGGVISPNLLDLLRVRPILGRPITPDDDRLGADLVVLLGHELWQTRFGADPAIIGQTVKLSDSHYTVVGIMPPGFRHEVGNQFWLPVVPTLDPSTRPSIRTLTVIGRLAPGASLAQLRGELDGLDPAVLRTAGPGGARQMRLTAAPLRARYAESTRSHDLIFASIVGCVLLIAVANLANLVLVRTFSMEREFAVRTAMGAGTARVVRGLLAQHLLVVGLAVLVGLGFATFLLQVVGSLEVMASLRPDGMEYRIDYRAWLFATGLAAVIGVVLSLVPARLVSRADLQRVLREGAPGASIGRRGSLFQQAFVVAQVAVAMVLLTGAGLMTRTVLRLSSLDPGFDTRRLVEASPSFPHSWRVPETYQPLTRQILDELRRLPGAGGVALRASVPLGPRGAAPRLTLEGQTEPIADGLAPRVGVAVSPEYFEAAAIPVLSGRGFGPGDLAGGLPVAMVNAWAATRWWPGQDPIGRTVRVDTLPGHEPLVLTIVGVVADNRAARPDLLLAEEGAELYRPYEQAPSPFPTFLVSAAGAPAGLLRPVREVLVRLVPDRPVFASLVSEEVEAQLSGVRVTAWQMLGFALVGLGLALVGIYGVLSYAVGRRTREIGIRGALGASRGVLGRMVLLDAARLAGLGLAIGLPLAVVASRLIEGLLHGTSRTDPAVYVLIAATVLVVALAASWIPARRASRVDPAEALRST